MAQEGILGDLCKQMDALIDERAPWEKTWGDIVKYVLPTGPRFDRLRGNWSLTLNKITDGPKAAERSVDIYDTTSVWAIDRLASGIESLVTSQSEKWHGLALDDPLAGPASHPEKLWLDLYRDHLFSLRYDPRSGFVTANQKAIRSASALGTGVYMTEEKFGIDKNNPRKVPFTYRYIPLSNAHIMVDYRGIPIGLYNLYPMTSHQSLDFFGVKCPKKIAEEAMSNNNFNRVHQFVHAVTLRRERGSKMSGLDKREFASYHFCYDEKEFIGDGGFFEFPYTVYYWHQDETTAYGESPVMMAIAEIKSLNVLSKHMNRAAQQWTDPPTMSTDDGIVNKPDLNPGRNNPGYLDPDTLKPRILPLITAQNPQFAEAIMAVKRDQVKESLYINLWQILLQNREMTATEALIRANEKGELIGPVGGKIQSGVAHTFEREHAILIRRNAFNPGSPLAPPETMRGKSFGLKWTSQYDRARRAPELLGAERVVGVATTLAAIDPDAPHYINTEEVMTLAQEIGGAPARVLRSKDEVDALKQAAQMTRAAAAAAQIGEQAGKAANAIIPAIGKARDLVGNTSNVVSGPGRPNPGRPLTPNTSVPGAV